jgi:hypothetical protein
LIDQDSSHAAKGETSFIFGPLVWNISSSILKLVIGFPTTIFVIGLLACTAVPHLAADETAAGKTPDTFFAGTVAQSTSETITVARTVRGKAESRTFNLTPQTKIEGKLVPRVRVTVRYVADDDGDTATLIVVRGLPKPSKQKKK